MTDYEPLKYKVDMVGYSRDVIVGMLESAKKTVLNCRENSDFALGISIKEYVKKEVDKGEV